MRKSTEAKLELTLFGTLLCVLSLNNFTRTSLYAALVRYSSFQSLTLWNIIIVDPLYVSILILISLISISSILSKDPYASRRLFYFALILFIPVALSFSQPNIIPFLAMTTTISIQEAIGYGTLIGCGLVLCTWYSEYARLMDDLVDRGIDDLGNIASLGLAFGIAIILISGLVTLSLSLIYVHLLNSTTFFTGLQPSYILILLFMILALEYLLILLIWYMTKSSGSPHHTQQ